jgi:membrane associated rhomboid family serine protease
MNPFAHDGVTIDVCPECRGLWLDPGEITKVTGADLELEASPETRLRPSGAAVDGAMLCPRCGLALREMAVRGAGSLRVDACEGCKGLYLDRGELQRVHDLQSRRLRHVRREDAELFGELQKSRRRSREQVYRPQSTRGVEVEAAHTSGRNMLVLLTGLPMEEGAAVSRPTFVLWGLLAIVLLVWIDQLTVGLGRSIAIMALVPEQILAGRRLHTLLTAMFAHASWFHVLANLYFLWVFGDNVEERVGSPQFLGWYLVWGQMAWVATLALAPSSWADAPHVGASGAIAGVMGAYIVLFPAHRIVAPLFGILIFGLVIKVPAWGYLGFWLALQLGFAALGVGGGVDWFAHVGGFVSGVVVGMGYRFASGNHPGVSGP